MRRMSSSVGGIAVLAGWACALAVTLAGVGCASPAGPRASSPQTRHYVEQGQDYLKKDQLDAALASFGLALENNPNLIDAQMGVGTAWRARGDYRKAKQAYQKAAGIDPNNFDARYSVGLMHQLLGEIRASVTAYLEALGINPDSVAANRDLGAAYLQLGQPAQAIPYARRATKLAPDSKRVWSNLAAAYSLSSQYAKAIDAYRQAAELGRLESPVLLGLADAHIKLGHYPRAINTLRTLIRTHPSATAYERLGYALFKRHEFQAALKNFETALNRQPEDIAALNGRGVAYMTMYIQGGRTKDFYRDQAVAAWRKSLRLNADQPRISNLLTRYAG